MDSFQCNLVKTICATRFQQFEADGFLLLHRGKDNLCKQIFIEVEIHG